MLALVRHLIQAHWVMLIPCLNPTVPPADSPANAANEGEQATNRTAWNDSLYNLLQSVIASVCLIRSTSRMANFTSSHEGHSLQVMIISQSNTIISSSYYELTATAKKQQELYHSFFGTLWVRRRRSNSVVEAMQIVRMLVTACTDCLLLDCLQIPYSSLAHPWQIGLHSCGRL